jgi:hypothetical protein
LAAVKKFSRLNIDARGLETSFYVVKRTAMPVTKRPPTNAGNQALGKTVNVKDNKVEK